MFQEVLKKYEQQEIGINLSNPTKIAPAILEKASEDYFTVKDNQKGLIFHYPYRSIILIAEGEGGSPIKSGGFFAQSFPVLIQVNHLIVYEGVQGFGIGFG